ncbi:MAG: hypothetical protein ACREPB_11505 [Arenimonas sp.]
MTKGKHVWLGVLFLISVSLPISSASAKDFCDGDWTFRKESLQEARRRIKSPVHKQVANRVDCGLIIRDALSTADFPVKCLDCEREYVQFLRDFIAYTRSTAERSTSERDEKEYYETEIEARKTLGEFLATSKNDELIDTYWSANFDGLGDAMERVGDGKQFHVEALTASSGHVMSDKSYKTWARAIRSCESWNFARGQNRDMKGLRKVLLCVDECRLALTKIRARVNQGRVVDKVLMGEILDGLLPALDSCPVDPQQ